MRQQQVRKASGQHYDVNIDSISFAALSACQGIHRNHENNFSNSVIVRRALRHYLESLNTMVTEDRMIQEVVEIRRAATGIQ